MATAEILDKKTGFSLKYYMNDRLKDNLDHKVIPALHDKDKDYIIVVDGREGAGKSTLAIQIGKYVDSTFNLDRVVFSPDEFRAAVLSAKKGQCIIYDEAFTGFSSRNSLSPINHVLVSLAMQMRQKNLFIIIVLPTIFLLDKYMALFRTRVLIHVFESKGNRGYFKLFNFRLKKYLILTGQKTMSYSHKTVRTNFKGRFYGKFALGDNNEEEKYRTKKMKALSESEQNPMTSGQIKYKEQRDIVIYCFRKLSNMKYQEVTNYFDEYDLGISMPQIAKICQKFGDIDEKEGEKSESKDKKVEEDIDLDNLPEFEDEKL